MHTHHAQNQLKRSGNSAAIRPITRAPTAAEAVHPYQYISGARKSKTGSAKSRERWRPKKNDALRRIHRKQSDPAHPRNDIKERKRRPKGKGQSGETSKRTSRSETSDIVHDVTNEERPPHNECQEYG